MGEKEVYVVQWTLLTWRQVLEGSKILFKVWTDHKNMEFLRTSRKLSPKQVRWMQYFNWFNFMLKYLLGGKKVLADILSWKSHYKSTWEEILSFIISLQQLAVQCSEKRRNWLFSNGPMKA